jgi:hypothetical protein
MAVRRPRRFGAVEERGGCHLSYPADYNREPKPAGKVGCGLDGCE